jgi:gliding motility-associated-like protein
MMTRLRNIGLLIMLLLAGRMAAQVPVLDSVCSGAVRHYGVNGQAGSTYSWIVTPAVGPAVTMPSDADTLEMIWNYAPGDYELEAIQHGQDGCDADAVFGKVVVVDQPAVFAGPPAIVCVNRYYKLLSSTAAHTSSLLWQTSGDGTFDDNTILHPTYTPGAGDIAAGTVTLTLTGDGLIADGGCDPDASSMVLSIVYFIVPQFDPIGPLCQYSIAPALPDTSLEGITGTWTPPTILTGILGTFPYTFSPNDPAQCGIDTTILITITDQIVPQFDPIGPLCLNSVPPALPDTSLEGIKGTWLPDTISTDVPGNFTYLFTPTDSTQCGVDTTMDIAIVTAITPEFDPIGPFCQFSTPPALPATDLHGISGTWNPLLINTSVPGTSSYTFTPYPDQCATDTAIEITINPQITPLFDPIGPLCQYSAAPDLPGISLNGITGIWNPAWISTAVPGVFTFTFIPDDPDQCGDVVTMDIAIVPEITPQFDPIGPLCLFSTPPALPDTSLQGITGTWLPPTITTNQTGTFYYTFTPDTVYHCVLDTTLAISVVSEILPEFDTIGPLCLNSIPPALPDTSNNGITGTWVPPVIDTSVPGTSNYTFTPDPGQCAVPNSISINIVTGDIIPQFDPIGPLCQNSIPPALPDTSLNGITGTWNPLTIDTSVPGISTYVFTPDPGQCGTVLTIKITITERITPEFDQIGPLCQGSVPPALPDSSNNGITGTWDPSTIDTSVPGVVTYLFTPGDPAQCSADTTMDITIATEIIPEFDPIGPLCLNSVPPDLPAASNNGITGTWVPPVINTAGLGTYTYTFSPDNTSECAVDTIMQIRIVPGITPQFDPIGPLCHNSEPPVLPAASNNGITGSWVPSVISTTIPGTVNYTFTPDSGQCAIVIVMPILTNENPQVTQTVVTDETNGMGNGVINITATGSVYPLSYSISNGASWQTDNGMFTSLSAGTYYCIVRDANDCDTSFTVVVNNIEGNILQAITIPGGHCMGDAAIVPVEVNNFLGVASFQLKLSYNTANLLCEGYGNVNPLLASHLTVLNDQANGVITLNWQDVSPLTFNGQTLVCNLFFTPKQPGLGQLDWYTDASDSYFNDLAGLPIQAEFFTGELIIYNPPIILLTDSKTACVGDKVTIIGAASGQYPPLTYQWTLPNGQTQAEDPFIADVTQADAGDYTLLVTDSLGCTDQKSIKLIVSENPVAAFHGSDTLTVPPGYTLDAGSGLAFYQWNTGEMTESITIDTTGWYWVDMESYVGCMGTDSVYVVVSKEILYNCLYVPNAFTPNGDGLNDTFKAVSRCQLSVFRMLIYNRWGQKLFETSDISNGWDGKMNGSTCPGDVYVYKIVYKASGAPESDKEQVMAGTVTIVK